jgi:hypothetical protein
MKVQVADGILKLTATVFQDAAQLVGAANSKMLPQGTLLLQKSNDEIEMNIPITSPQKEQSA